MKFRVTNERPTQRQPCPCHGRSQRRRLDPHLQPACAVKQIPEQGELSTNKRAGNSLLNPRHHWQKKDRKSWPRRRFLRAPAWVCFWICAVCACSGTLCLALQQPVLGCHKVRCSALPSESGMAFNTITFANTASELGKTVAETEDGLLHKASRALGGPKYRT